MVFPGGDSSRRSLPALAGLDIKMALAALSFFPPLALVEMYLGTIKSKDRGRCLCLRQKVC